MYTKIPKKAGIIKPKRLRTDIGPTIAIRILSMNRSFQKSSGIRKWNICLCEDFWAEWDLFKRLLLRLNRQSALCNFKNLNCVFFSESAYIWLFKLDLKLACHYEVLKTKKKKAWNCSNCSKSQTEPNGANMSLIFAIFPSCSKNQLTFFLFFQNVVLMFKINRNNVSWTFHIAHLLSHMKV